MNPAAVLSLIADLYSQIGDLQNRNVQLEKQLAEAKQKPQPPA